VDISKPEIRGKKRKIPESDFLKRKSVPYRHVANRQVANRKNTTIPGKMKNPEA
jgi:hypothetical protein